MSGEGRQRQQLQHILLELMPLYDRARPLPRDLLTYIETLVAKSRKVRLKPTEEVARTQVCAYIACTRLCIYFDLPDVRARNTYVPQRTFHELARQFDARLPHSTVIEGVPSLRQLTAVSAVAGSDGNSESNSTMTERQLTELLCQQLGLDTTMKEAALWMQAAIKTTYPTDEAYKSDGAAVAAGAVCALFAHLHPGANLTDNRSRLQRSLKVVRNETGATQARIDHWTQIIDAQALKLSWFENLAELPSRGHEARQARVTHGLGSMSLSDYDYLSPARTQAFNAFKTRLLAQVNGVEKP